MRLGLWVDLRPRGVEVPPDLQSAMRFCRARTPIYTDPPTRCSDLPRSFALHLVTGPLLTPGSRSSLLALCPSHTYRTLPMSQPYPQVSTFTKHKISRSKTANSHTHLGPKTCSCVVSTRSAPPVCVEETL